MDHAYAQSGPSKGSKPPKSNSYCCVPQCFTYSGSGIHFHFFPVKEEWKKKWVTALKMGKPTSSFMRVCSKHFLPSDYFPRAEGKRPALYPHAVPSQNLPLRTHDKVLTSPSKRVAEARSRRALKRSFQNINDGCVAAADDEEMEVDVVDNTVKVDERVLLTVCCDASTQVNHIDDRENLVHNAEGLSLADLFCKLNITDKCTQVNLKAGSRTTLSKGIRSISLAGLLNTDEKLYCFTGIHSLELLEGLVECAAELDIDPPTNKKILPLKDRILITMVKLKVRLSFSAIAVLYGVSRQTVPNYFKHMCPILARILKVMVPWPNEELVRDNLPIAFRRYRNTRIILDCAETNVQQSKCLKCRILSYSQYKKNFTIKYQVGIAPSGLITEISPPYGGRASDKFIVNDSQILDRLDPLNGVMVDKGYRIEKETMERFLKLHRPPFLSKRQQMSKEDATATAEIARARVHVERVIGRLREYKFLRETIPWHLVGYVEDCLFIAAGLTNLGPPVIGTHRFM